MNEQTSKKIHFNKSTLFSLKAELLKKQEEVYDKKQLPQHKPENFKPNPVKTIDKNVGTKSKTLKDNLKAVDTEELEAYKKSKASLEKKAELYEHLSDISGSSQLAGSFLVDFKSKKQQETVTKVSDPPAESEYIDDDSEWTEFVDCLGRTRKCLKTDLARFKERDKQLIRTEKKDDANEHEDSNKPETPKPFLVQKTNDYLQTLRQKWEEKEKELLAKDKDIHYQDLLFDEARMHGVAYYSFSTNEAERRKQMEELIKHREETLKAQKESEEKRKKRDELLAARVAAARARQRARAGLPPEDPDEKNKKDFTTCLLEFLTQQKEAAEAKANEEEKKIREEKEKERQKLREAYIREWDVGKLGVGNAGTRFREMSQEEYVEQQRAKRLEEFAPPQTLPSSSSEYEFDDKGRKIQADEEKSAADKTWSDVRPRISTPPPPPAISDYQEQKGLYFSSVKKSSDSTESMGKYSNFVKAQEPRPIINEVDDVAEELCVPGRSKERNQEDSHEVAPPPTYDYYGPVAKRSKQDVPFKSDIQEAYAQGLKSLEKKHTHRKLPAHYDFMLD